MSAIARDSVLGRINALLAEVDGEKQASEMDTSGGGAKDPGGYVAPSSHPSAKKDDRSGPAAMGNRAKENEKDVKEVYPAAVDNTSPGSGGTQDDKAYNIGTHVSATGEDPKTEDNYKGDKEDPGTSHPANAEEIGEKYSSMRTDILMKEAFDHLNNLLASIANGEEIKIDVEPQAKNASEAARRGYELSNELLKTPSQSFDKTAAARMVIERTINEALSDADNVGQYLMARQAMYAEQVKAANQMPPEAAGGMPPMDPGSAAPQEGGMPPEAMMPPEGEGHGEPDGDEASPHNQEAAIAELAAALQELGISPEELMAATAHAGGAPEGVPEEALPKTASHSAGKVKHMAESLTKYAQDAKALFHLSADVMTLMDSKGVKIKSAKQGTRLRAERDEIKDYITEVCGLR